jgi:hypothetical protein
MWRRRWKIGESLWFFWAIGEKIKKGGFASQNRPIKKRTPQTFLQMKAGRFLITQQHQSCFR